MASSPPVPPRPYEYASHRQGSLPPPVPPVPPDLRAQETRYQTPSPYELPDSQSRPLAAPRPFRVDPSIAANMQMVSAYDEPIRYPSPLPPPFPPQQQPPSRADWSPWAPSVSSSQIPFSSPPQIPFSSPGQPISMPQQPMPPSQPIPQSQPRPQPVPSPPRSSTSPPSLTAPLPTISNLQGAIHAVQNPSHDPFLKIAWCRDVFFLVDRAQKNPSPTTDPPVGPVTITDPILNHLANIAVPIVLQLANSTQSPLPVYAAEAIFWRAIFAASGAYPEFIKHNPRVAFRDFETSARGGYATAWFRLGRDYENFNDTQHAKECFERGVKLGVESCAYRMGMAHLLGQLGLSANPQLAIPLLSRAATLATTHVPQPAYVYALLLLNEFTQTSVPASFFTPLIPQGSSPLLEARKHLERAAFLHFAPAQYKLGHAYEYAQPPFPFDPLLSVQYYSLASQQGEVEADMALSKWFLCGSGDDTGGAGSGFDKDEVLALTFAEKAANKGLPSAEFAMGYYAEVGVGGPKDIQTAIRWYTKARDHGNTDAAERLAALTQPSPQSLSRQEHDTITENKLVRKRTQAKQRSDALPANYPPMPNIQNGHLAPGGGVPGGGAPAPIKDGRVLVDVIRKQSLANYPGPGPSGPHPQQRPPPGNINPPRPQSHQPQSQSQPHHPHAPSPSTSSTRPGYSLSDSPRPASLPSFPGTGGPSPRPPNARPGGRIPGGNESGGGTGGGLGAVPGPHPPQQSKPQKMGPATFAEMGIQGAKAESDGCVIM